MFLSLVGEAGVQANTCTYRCICHQRSLPLSRWHSSKPGKKNYSVQTMLWIKHMNYGYWCAESLCPCVLEIKLRALRNKELQSRRRTLITVLPLNKYCQSCLASVLLGLLKFLPAITQKSDWWRYFLPLPCVPVGHGTPTCLKESLMLPLSVVTAEAWMPPDPVPLWRPSWMVSCPWTRLSPGLLECHSQK